MSLAIGCFAELYVTASTPVLRAAFALNDHVPAHCRPIGGNVLLQVLCTALYSAFLEISARNEPEDVPTYSEVNCELSPFNPYNRTTAATALAEAICSIDEDNKHTAQIESFVLLVKDRFEILVYFLYLFFYICFNFPAKRNFFRLFTIKSSLLQPRERGSEFEKRRVTEHDLCHRDVHGRIVIHA